MLYWKRKARGFTFCTGVEEGAAVAGAGAGAAGAGTAAAGGLTLASVAPYISAAVAAAGMYAQNQAQNEAADRQRQILQQSAQRDAALQQKSLGIAQNEGQQYDPTLRAQNETAAQDAAQQSLTSSLVASREGAAPPAATAGKVSNDFTTGQATTAAGELQRSTNIAKLMAAMRGPTDLRVQEGINNADFAEQEGSLAGDRSNLAGASNIDASAVHPDGTQMLLGQGAQTLGTAGLASSLSKKAAAVPVAKAPPLMEGV